MGRRILLLLMTSSLIIVLQIRPITSRAQQAASPARPQPASSQPQPAASQALPASPPAPKDTAAVRKKAMDLLRRNLRATGLNQSSLNSYLVTDAYADKRSGNFLVYLQQTYLGISVYNKIGVYIFRNDTLVGKTPDFIGRIEGKAGTKTSYGVSPAQAVLFAARHLSISAVQQPALMRKDDVRQHFVYGAAGLSRQEIPADLVWLPLNGNKEVRLTWNVRIVAPKGDADWYVRIDAQSGEVLEKSSLIVHEKADENCDVTAPVAPTAAAIPAAPAAQTAPDRSMKMGAFMPPAASSAAYRVYPFPLESGNFGSRILDNNPWLRAGVGNNAISLGWHYDNTANYDFTRGNNVWALEDTAGHSQTAGFADTSSTTIPALTFDRPLDPSLTPFSYSNIRAAMDNLFYWNNIMHDISYQYGFDEAAGNFQADNQGRGGSGNDYVHAFAEDGAGVDNSDFSTPPDGENPRMRMFEWNSAVVPSFHVNTPAPIAISYTIAESSLGIKNQLAYTGPVTADIVLADDVPATTHQACGTLGNASGLANKIVLIDRGACNFVIKIKNAQNAGARAVIIINNTGGAPTVIGGSDSTITIPAVMVSNTDGATLKANLTGLNGTLSSAGQLIDGSFDNGVISHEYTHGISNRLTGGPAHTDCLANAEQMGEGWSDYMALMVTTDWSAATVADGPNKRSLGTYVSAQPATGPGIRTYPYSTDMGVNPWTYGMLAGSTGGEAHKIGEIWCAALWDMTWNIIQLEGIDHDIYHGTGGNNIALQLVLTGMKYQPCSPGFLDGRDAILAADSLLYNYAHKCAIWNAFARRGMGKSAVQGSSNNYTDQTAATDLPSGLGISQSSDKASVLQGDNITYTIKAYCDCSPLTNVSIVDTLSGNLSYVSSPGGTYTAPYIRFNGLDLAANETRTFTVQAKVSGTYIHPDTLINDSRDPDAYSWTNAFTTGGTLWSESTTRSHSPSHAWYAADQPFPTDFTLTSGDLILDTVSTLSFWHYYETDPAFDGGVVEISTDGGGSWQDLGPWMTQNTYNMALDATSTGIPNRRAFSGSSGGVFIQTVIPLTGFAGVTAKIRFRFTSDGVAGDEGWYIDDILLKNETGVVSMASAFSGSTLLSKNNAFSPFAVVPLPVNFLGFDAKAQNKTARLHWKVNAAINVDKYIVERSADGNSFMAIGEVPGGLSDSSDLSGAYELDYSFTDAQPLAGNNFYRIVERDLDGKSTFSVIRGLRFDGGPLFVRVSPVPTYDHTVQLEIGTGNEKSVSVSLINTVGQILKVYTVRPGVNQLSLDNLARGIYFLNVQTGNNNTVIRKIVIQ